MITKPLVQILFCLMTSSLVASARADDSVQLKIPAEASGTAAWREECGSCHLAYPPGFLPADSWRALMAGLERHFGVDAGLDPKVRGEILDLLIRYAGSGRRHSATPLRISETAWFRHEHDEVPAPLWQSPRIKSAANCQACHLEADTGHYSERSLRIPR